MGVVVPVRAIRLPRPALTPQVEQAPTVRWAVPVQGQTLPANKNITMLLNVKNIQAGVFVDAQGPSPVSEGVLTIQPSTSPRRSLAGFATSPDRAGKPSTTRG